MLKRHHPPVYYDVQRIVSFIAKVALVAAFFIGPFAGAAILGVTPS